MTHPGEHGALQKRVLSDYNVGFFYNISYHNNRHTTPRRYPPYHRVHSHWVQKCLLGKSIATDLFHLSLHNLLYCDYYYHPRDISGSSELSGELFYAEVNWLISEPHLRRLPARERGYL